MTSDVVLTAAMRNNLLSLQGTQSSIDKIQSTLASGLKVASALDNPQNFFASESLKNRAGDLTRLLDAMGQSIQTVKAADKGVSGITKLIDQAESIIASAEEAITSGQVEAAITGNVDLRGIENLVNLPGIAATDEIQFDYVDKDGTAQIDQATGQIAIAANDSIEQLITKINDIDGGGVFKAELTSKGYLKITDLNGNDFNMAFEAIGSGGGASAKMDVVDLNMASALGFGQAVQATGGGIVGAPTIGVGQYSVTVLANTKLVSGEFFEGSGTGYADASATLVSVASTEGAAADRFDAGGSDGNTANIVFTVNGDTAITVAFDSTTTIQGLVDQINTDTNNTGLLEASYDATTGKFTIEATSQTVESVNVSFATDGAEAETADFDFGMKSTFTTAGAGSDESFGETFKFANAAATLSQYENDYNTLQTQIDQMAEDSGYRGVNLLNGDDLTTYFDEDRVSQLTVSGGTLTSAGLSMTEADFSTVTTIAGTKSEVLAAKATVRSFGSTLANGLSVIQTREEFTKEMVSTLTEGSDKLTVADQNEEGAKLLALQTRQQLGVVSLSLASQAQQAVLRLF
jgi:flagellin-like hook-associated protein FlgL